MAIALTAALLAVSSAAARAPQTPPSAKAHAAQTGESTHDGTAIAVIGGLGLLIAGSALVPLGRRRGAAAPA
jgi:hypothetical protein